MADARVRGTRATDTGTTRTDRLAAYADAFSDGQLPPAAVAAAKLILLDTIGAMLLGSQPIYPASRLTGDLARDLGGTPECTVVGRGFKADLAAAALANGTTAWPPTAASSRRCWPGHGRRSSCWPGRPPRTPPSPAG